MEFNAEPVPLKSLCPHCESLARQTCPGGATSTCVTAHCADFSDRPALSKVHENQWKAHDRPKSRVLVSFRAAVTRLNATLGLLIRTNDPLITFQVGVTRFTAPHVVDPPLSVTHRGDPQGRSHPGDTVWLCGGTVCFSGCTLWLSGSRCGSPGARHRTMCLQCGAERGWLRPSPNTTSPPRPVGNVLAALGPRPPLIKTSAAPGDTTTVNDRFCLESHSCVSCQYLSRCWPPHTPRNVYGDWVLARLCTVMTKLILVMAPACSGTAMRSLQDGLFIRVVSRVRCRWRTCERHKSPAWCQIQPRTAGCVKQWKLSNESWGVCFCPTVANKWDEAMTASWCCGPAANVSPLSWLHGVV